MPLRVTSTHQFEEGESGNLYLTALEALPIATGNYFAIGPAPAKKDWR